MGITVLFCFLEYAFMLVRNAPIMQLPGMVQPVCDTRETFPRQQLHACLYISLHPVQQCGQWPTFWTEMDDI